MRFPDDHPAKILVIEDDPDYAEMLQRQFTDLEHQATISPCLKEGVCVAEALNPDVIFLDVGLPDGSGLNAIGVLKGLPGHPEVIIVTGRGSADGAELAIRSGAWDYVCKGGSFQEIALALTRALNYRRQKLVTSPCALNLSRVISRSPAMRPCLNLLAEAASSEANVLVSGETGTGKEVLAVTIHENSKRSSGRMVVVDCSALPENLVESLLFGHEKGAFTGAEQKGEGLIKAADGGTLFLDEVGELPLPTQRAFLRVLQEHVFRSVGSIKEVSSDFRLIAATNRDLDQLVKAGSFREDLLYRLRTINIEIPPLRERKEDIWDLMGHFMREMHKRYGDGIKGFSPEFLEAATSYTWPGNVRELKSAMESAYLHARGLSTLFSYHLPSEIRVQLKKDLLEPQKSDLEAESAKSAQMPAPWSPLSLSSLRKKAEHGYLQDLLDYCGGDLQEASRIAELSKSRLYAMLKRNNIPLKRFTPKE